MKEKVTKWKITPDYKMKENVSRKVGLEIKKTITNIYKNQVRTSSITQVHHTTKTNKIKYYNQEEPFVRPWTTTRANKIKD